MFHVVPVPCLKDNYSYLILDETTKKAAVVDPVEPEKVLVELKKQGYRNEDLTHVLTTHSHLDHSGGNKEIAERLKHLSIVGGSNDSIPAVTKKVDHDDEFKVGSMKVKVLHTPCHTKGHVLYYVSADKKESPPALFSGDTLFVAGCGRFF